ncbi:Uncharacterised protein [Mycobacterium tuberculosis]|uniref:Uncharacterized protein n=2 Tax=Mycobacterium tuberculosis TaxID=1773 RepID=A0A655JQA2_MYCTX|nr:Uncharacterised protein [Mycobacterium tuberculosis]
MKVPNLETGYGHRLFEGTASTDDRFLDRRPARGLPLREHRPGLLVGDAWCTPVRYLRLAGPAPAQQPRQPAVDLVERRCPPRDDLRLRAGKRDIGEPEVVVGRLDAVQPLNGAPLSTAVLAADVQAAGAVVVIQQDVVAADVAVEGERQIHDGKLQSLGHEDGHDLHRRGVAVQPAIVFRRAGTRLGLAAQPIAQPGQAEPLAMSGLVQQLRNVRQVCQVPFAAALAQHAPAHPGQLSGLKHRGHTAMACVVGPLAQRAGHPIGQRIALGGKRFRGLTEEHRARGGADQPAALRRVERLQQAQPVLGGLRGEHVGVTGVDRRDARLRQRIPARPRVFVMLDDHRDVCGHHGPPGEGGPAGQ